jgi:cell division septum initiation protein DivIVA
MKVLGLLDTLESLILDGFKVPLSKKVMVDEEKLLSIIDKIRLVLQNGDELPAKAQMQTVESIKIDEQPAAGNNSSADVLAQAYKLAKEIREGADKYADEVLANLELTSSRVLRTIRAGRERLDQTVRGKEELENV